MQLSGQIIHSRFVTRVHLLVFSNPVGVNQVLETFSKPIGLVVRWVDLISFHSVDDRGDSSSASFLIHRQQKIIIKGTPGYIKKSSF